MITQRGEKEMHSDSSAFSQVSVTSSGGNHSSVLLNMQFVFFYRHLRVAGEKQIQALPVLTFIRELVGRKKKQTNKVSKEKEGLLSWTWLWRPGSPPI